MAGRSQYPGAEQFRPDTTSLAALRDAANSCQGCDLYANATQTVFGRGSRRAPLMLVGEQPGDVEDREGRAFIGPAGRMLDQALEQAGLADTDVYVTNAVKHFSYVERGKRRIHQTPRIGQITACRPWLTAEIAAVDPALIVCMGSTAVRSLLGADARVLRDRGAITERDSEAGRRRYLITVHPSSVLRGPPEERQSALAALVADLAVAAEALSAA